MQVTVISEGIERSADLEAVRSLAVDAGQGYLVGRPTSVPEDWRNWDGQLARRQPTDIVSGEPQTVPRLHWRLGSGSTARKGTDGAGGLVCAAECAVRRRVAALFRTGRLGALRRPRRGTMWTRPLGRLARKALVVPAIGFICLAGYQDQRVRPPAAESGSGPNSHAMTSA